MTIRAFGILAAAVAAASAQAGFDTIEATFNGVSPGSNGTYSLDGGANWTASGAAGQFNWTRTGGTYAGAQGAFMAFCTELTEHVGAGNGYSYEVKPLELAPDSLGGMGAAKAELIRELFGRFYSPAFGAVLSSDRATAMQLSIWEIVYENHAGLDLNSGAAQFTNDNAAAFTLAQSYLAALDGSGPRDNSLMTMSAAGIQDQIIPTPGSLALMGLGVLAAARRRR